MLAFVHVDSLDDVMVLPAEFGFLAGPLFAREGGQQVLELSSVEAEALITTGASELFSRYWGPCCAILHNRGYDYFHAVRDPAGSNPIYVWRTDRLHCLFTHVDDFLICCDEPVSCDEKMLGIYMVQPRILTKRTAIEDVEELLAGERLTLGRTSVERKFIWSPTQSGRTVITDFDQARGALRAAVMESATSWAQYNDRRGANPIAHRLSGGLDSSIVLTALRKAAGEEVICFHEYPEATPEGDERAFARAAALHAGCELIEHESKAGDFDYGRILNQPLPARPTHTEFSHANTSLGDAIAARGARVVTSGQGGDQVLHRRRFAEIAADAALDRAGLGRYFSIAQDTARLARVPIWSVFAKTIERSLISQASFLNNAFTQAVLAHSGAIELAEEEWRDHPLRQELLNETPARTVRALHIGDLSYYFEVSEITRRFETAPILASLPVIETVLAIPPYVMTQGGIDRALARAAFRDCLPTEIVERSSKGDTTRFHNRVLERQLGLFREVLLDGELARRQLLDRAAIERALKPDFVANGAIKGALMSAFMAEAWLQRFLRRTAPCLQTNQGAAVG
ncbi:MAG: asparagine synthase C-terminal domain-containing protein [Hyphomonadaceae bacterium]